MNSESYRSPFSLQAQREAVLKSLLEHPPADGRKRIRVSFRFPDGTVIFDYVQATDTGHVAMGVGVKDLLHDPTVEAHMEWCW